MILAQLSQYPAFNLSLTGTIIVGREVAYAVERADDAGKELLHVKDHPITRLAKHLPVIHQVHLPNHRRSGWILRDLLQSTAA